MLNVRLTKEQEKELKEYCEQKNLPKSQVVKEALAAYIKTHRTIDGPYEVGKELFGQVGSGKKDRSTKYKQLLNSKLNEKHSH